MSVINALRCCCRRCPSWHLPDLLTAGSVFVLPQTTEIIKSSCTLSSIGSLVPAFAQLVWYKFVALAAVGVYCIPAGLSASLGIADYVCGQLRAAGLINAWTTPTAIPGSVAYKSLSIAQQHHQYITHPISKLGLQSKL